MSVACLIEQSSVVYHGQPRTRRSGAELRSCRPQRLMRKSDKEVIRRFYGHMSQQRWFLLDIDRCIIQRWRPYNLGFRY